MKQTGIGAPTQKIDGARVFREIIDKQNANRRVYIGKDGWPVGGIIGRPVVTFLRRLLFTRKIEHYSAWLKRTGIRIEFPKLTDTIE